MQTDRWFLHRACLLEFFVLSNIAFLGLDIYIAHSFNAFAARAEWIPIAFSAAATAILLASFPTRQGNLSEGWRKSAGLLVGAAAITIGLTGMLLHLESQFFSLMSIKSLVYTAPFVAPLAYTGVGFLLLMNRMIDMESREWGAWVVFLALGGAFGNFVLAVCDHAQNGFFNPQEWIPVVVSAFAVGFLLSVIFDMTNAKLLQACLLTLVLQGGAGLLGFYYHVAANAEGPSQSLRENFLFGAPAFAPLLLPNISALAALGLWCLWDHAKFSRETSGMGSAELSEAANR